MKLRLLVLLSMLGALLSLFPALTPNQSNIEDFVGKRFAVKEGTIFHELAEEEFAATEVLLFDDYPSIYESLLAGKADAALRGYLSARVTGYEPRYANLSVIRLADGTWEQPLGAISMDQQLIDAFNVTLNELQATGGYQEMAQRWFDGFDPLDVPQMPEIPLSGENGTLVVAISSDYVPFSFLGPGGTYLGFDIELITRVAAALGKSIEFEDMAFSAVLPSVISGRADFGISDIVITSERAEQVLFTEPYFLDDTALVYRDDAAIAEQAAESGTDDLNASGGFAGWIQSGIQRNLVQDGRWRMIVDGLGITLVISLAAQVLGTILGAGLCFLLLRNNRIAKGFAKVFCTLVSGTPDLVLLMVIYYVVFGRSPISNIFVAIVAFTILKAVIISETMESAIETVDPSEIEAAESLGFSPFHTFTTVTLPQATHQALPGYLSDFVELVKGTAVVGFIAIMDLTRAGDVIRSHTYDAYFPILVVALIYILVTTLLVFCFKKLVNRINTGAFA